VVGVIVIVQTNVFIVSINGSPVGQTPTIPTGQPVTAPTLPPVTPSNPGNATINWVLNFPWNDIFYNENDVTTIKLTTQLTVLIESQLFNYNLGIISVNVISIGPSPSGTVSVIFNVNFNQPQPFVDIQTEITIVTNIIIVPWTLGNTPIILLGTVVYQVSIVIVNVNGVLVPGQPVTVPGQPGTPITPSGPVTIVNTEVQFTLSLTWNVKFQDQTSPEYQRLVFQISFVVLEQFVTNNINVISVQVTSLSESPTGNVIVTVVISFTQTVTTTNIVELTTQVYDVVISHWTFNELTVISVIGVDVHQIGPTSIISINGQTVIGLPSGPVGPVTPATTPGGSLIPTGPNIVTVTLKVEFDIDFRATYLDLTNIDTLQLVFQLNYLIQSQLYSAHKTLFLSPWSVSVSHLPTLSMLPSP
jgi:hypothetical protein